MALEHYVNNVTMLTAQGKHMNRIFTNSAVEPASAIACYSCSGAAVAACSALIELSSASSLNYRTNYNKQIHLFYGRADVGYLRCKSFKNNIRRALVTPANYSTN